MRNILSPLLSGGCVITCKGFDPVCAVCIMCIHHVYTTYAYTVYVCTIYTGVLCISIQVCVTCILHMHVYATPEYSIPVFTLCMSF